MVLVPGGASVALKSKLPNMAAYADKDGLRRDELSKFSVIIAWGINLSHSFAGKFVSHRYKPLIKLFLNMPIARSTALRPWTCGVTSWYFTLTVLNACFVQ